MQAALLDWHARLRRCGAADGIAAAGAAPLALLPCRARAAQCAAERAAYAASPAPLAIRLARAAPAAPTLPPGGKRSGRARPAAALAPGTQAPAAASSGGAPAPAADDPAAAERAAALALLRRLCLYVPRGRGGGVFGDGPSSLARAAPYRRLEYAAALAHGRALLPELSLRQLAGVASALAAARHDGDPAFLRALAAEAAARLRADAAAGGGEWGPACHLALAFARLGVADAALMRELAASAALLLERGAVKLSSRRRLSQLAGLLAAFAALRMRPPRLLAAAAEALKARGRPPPLALLGPWESVVVVWAFGRLAAGGGGSGVDARSEPAAAAGGAQAAGAVDAAAWSLLLEHSTTVVGQLPRHDLCRAYCMAADACAPHPPLLAALRRALRQRAGLLKGGQLAAALCGLAALGHRDLLLMDELARWVRNKAATCSTDELCDTLSALAALRYRNPWLMDHLSRVLATPKLNHLRRMGPHQMAAAAAALAELRWRCGWLLDALGAEAEGRLARAAPGAEGGGMAGADVAAVVTSLAVLSHPHGGLLDAACAAAEVALSELPPQAGGVRERWRLRASSSSSSGGGDSAPQHGGAGDAASPSGRAGGGSKSGGGSAAAAAAAWGLEDAIAVAWAAAAAGRPPPAGLLRAAAAAAEAAGQALDLRPLVRLAWACAVAEAAGEEAAAGRGMGDPAASPDTGLAAGRGRRRRRSSSGSDSAAGSSDDGGAPPGAERLLPLLRERLSALAEREPPPAALRALGTEGLQLLQRLSAARPRAAPRAAEAVWLAAARAALAAGARGAALARAAQELRRLLSTRQRASPFPHGESAPAGVGAGAGAATSSPGALGAPYEVQVAYRVPGTLLLADIALLPAGTQGLPANPQPDEPPTAPEGAAGAEPADIPRPLAVFLVDPSAWPRPEGPGSDAPGQASTPPAAAAPPPGAALLARREFERAGWGVAWLHAGEWARAQGRSAMHELLERCLSGRA